MPHPTDRSERITPFLWFDDRAEEAARFYTSIFPDSAIDGAGLVADDAPEKPMIVRFRLDGQPFIALNGGPVFTFSPAISFFVRCETQAEVDHFWEKLSAGGEQQQCGWLKDRFGVSWQIVPSILGDLLGDDDEATSQRVYAAMLTMRKLDIAALQAAAHAG